MANTKRRPEFPGFSPAAREARRRAMPTDLAALRTIEERLRFLACHIIHHANHAFNPIKDNAIPRIVTITIRTRIPVRSNL